MFTLLYYDIGVEDLAQKQASNTQYARIEPTPTKPAGDCQPAIELADSFLQPIQPHRPPSKCFSSRWDNYISNESTTCHSNDLSKLAFDYIEHRSLFHELQ